MSTVQATMGLGDSLLISVVGMLVVMLELFLLYLFVRLLATVTGKVAAKTKATAAAAEAPVETAPTRIDSASAQPENPDANAVQMAAALAAAFAEAGVTPETNQALNISAEKVN